MPIASLKGVSEDILNATHYTEDGKPYTLNYSEKNTFQTNFIGQGESSANAQGWERNSNEFFDKMKNEHPEMFSRTNLQRISASHNPIVDAKMIAHNPQFAEYKGDTLIEHHIGGDGEATALPYGMHKGYGGVHNDEKKAGITEKCKQYSNGLQRNMEKNIQLNESEHENMRNEVTQSRLPDQNSSWQPVSVSSFNEKDPGAQQTSSGNRIDLPGMGNSQDPNNQNHNDQNPNIQDPNNQYHNNQDPNNQDPNIQDPNNQHHNGNDHNSNALQNSVSVPEHSESALTPETRAEAITVHSDNVSSNNFSGQMRGNVFSDEQTEGEHGAQSVSLRGMAISSELDAYQSGSISPDSSQNLSYTSSDGQDQGNFAATDIGNGSDTEFGGESTGSSQSR